MKLALILAAVLGAGLAAGSTLMADEVVTGQRGPETNLPLPRYVSLKSHETNVRRGPSLSFKIDWVFKREDLPVEITAEYGQWRQVRDAEGAGGWVHYSLLSGARTVMLTEDLAALRTQPKADAQANAYAELGVVARLGSCLPDWCWISVDGARGWTAKSALWGVGKVELRD